MLPAALAIVGGATALGVWIAMRAKPKAPKASPGINKGPTPANVPVVTTSASGAQQFTTYTPQGVAKPDWSAYWNGLSAPQQQSYRQGLWNWLSNNPNEWPSTYEPAAQMGITSLDSLMDVGTLTAATDGYQYAKNIGPAVDPNGGAGIVDEYTYNSVVNTYASG